jgi:hypothetical protein
MILEIRTYRLRPGTRSEFLRLMRDEALPLLERHGITVVDCGAPLVDEAGVEEAFLIRAFPSLAAHQIQEERFYASDEWLNGPREGIFSCLESYHTITLEASEDVVRGLQS